MNSRKYTREEYFRIWLSSVDNVGAVTFRRLIERYGSAEAVWDSFGEEMRWAGDKAWQSMSEARDRDKAAALIERIGKAGAEAVFMDDPGYPKMLRALDDAPPLLYVKGRADLSDEVCVSIVGTREPSAYGVRSASSIAGELARSGACVVSGFAMGIDTAAHEGALEAGGRTVAVFGCGVDVVYPPQNGALYERLLHSGGSVISEYPPGTPPLGGRFPARNRLISGMSRGALIVEGRWRSGAKITAGDAADQGRDVFVLPGNIDEAMSELPNRLARDGARVITSAADILDDLNLFTLPQTPAKKKPRGNSPKKPVRAKAAPGQEPMPQTGESAAQTAAGEFATPDDSGDPERAAVLAAYRSGAAAADDIVEKTGIDAGRVNTVLTMLALEGIIQ